MEFDYSLVKWFSRQFSVGFMYSIHFDVLYNYLIRSKFFDLYCTFADYNKRILCTSLRQSKVSLKQIYYVLLLNTMYM